jgi:hypothetical protein
MIGKALVLFHAEAMEKVVCNIKIYTHLYMIQCPKDSVIII